MKVSLLVTLFDILKRKFATFATQTAVNVHDIFLQMCTFRVGTWYGPDRHTDRQMAGQDP